MSFVLEGLAPLLQVYDMPRAVGFYRDVLGGRVEQHSPARGPDDFDWCLISLGGADLMLNTAYEHDARPGAPDPATVRSHGDTALYFGCRDPDAAAEVLRARGADPAPPATAPYGMRQVYLRDPDGYNVCLQWPASRAPTDRPTEG